MSKWRSLLYPFSILYDGVTAMRNVAYDKGWFESERFNVPVICVGNLSTGGTGKSPMIEHLISILKSDFKIAVVSRGYGRKTTGFYEVKTTDTALKVGDEPLQIKQNHPDVLVVVCEKRRVAIEKIKNKVDVVLLDDAFQHRSVTPSFTIMLTPFDDLYYNDFVLPAGNLRESRSGAARADVIVVTKCPSHVPYAHQQQIQYDLKLLPHQRVYFSTIGYDDTMYSNTEALKINYLKGKKFTLVTGIAKPEPFVEFLKAEGLVFDHKKYPDHHNFTKKEYTELKKEELIVTTQKDYVRLQPSLGKFALYYIPIETKLLSHQSPFFQHRIKDAVENFTTQQ